MDRVIVYTTDPAQCYAKTRPEKLFKAQKKANRFLKSPIASVPEISALRNSLFRSQHMQNHPKDLRNLELFSRAVKSALIAQNVPPVLKSIQLFVFLSYIAVTEKRLTELRLMKKKSRDDKEKEKKTLKRSIREQRLNVQDDADAIKRIYDAVADLETAIYGFDQTITGLDTAMKRLNEATVEALSGDQAGTEPAERSPDFLKRLRTGTLNIHRVIGGLVKKGWTPAQATMSIISRVVVKYWLYVSIDSNCVEPLVAGLESEGLADLAPSHDNIGDSNGKLCIAKEITDLDSSFELQQTHQDLGYIFGSRSDFPCTTCFPECPPTTNPREPGVGRAAKVSDRPCFDLVPTPPNPPLSRPLDELLCTITTYFEFSCRNLNLDDQGVLLTQTGVKRRNDPCDSFDSYCLSATIFARNGMLNEFSQALNKACTYVDDILRDEHPRALTCFFEVFIHLIQSGLSGFTLELLRYVGYLYEVKGGHPLGRIFRSLLDLDHNSLPQAMAIAWWCTSNTFDRTLGPCSSLAMSVRLDYIKRVHGVRDYVEEERLLRNLLAQLNGTLHPSVPRVMLNLAHNMNKQGRYDHARALAGEVLVLIGEHKKYADKTVERIESQKIIAISYHAQGSMVDAESTQRCAIRLVEDAWGRQHAWLAEFMNVLETWLRGWGRDVEANIVRAEITELMIENRWRELAMRSR